VKPTTFSVGALTLGAFLFSPTTHAQPRSFITDDAGFYWWIDAGATIPQDGHLTEFGGWTSGQTVKYDVGGGLDVAAGYAFNQYIATELQFGGTWNSIDSIEGGAVDDTYFATAPILANLVLQCPIPRTRLVPYLGAGVGGAATVFDTDGFTLPAPGGSVTLYGSEADFVFAWQAFAGLRFELNDRMSIGLTYRYLTVDDSTYGFDSWVPGDPDLDLGFSNHESHFAAISFRMSF